jgi:hypothetical protein
MTTQTAGNVMPSLETRVQDLRSEAENRVKACRVDVDHARKEFMAAGERLRDAVALADTIGLDRASIAQAAEVSENTAGAWIRAVQGIEPKSRKKKVPEPDVPESEPAEDPEYREA